VLSGPVTSLAASGRVDGVTLGGMAGAHDHGSTRLAVSWRVRRALTTTAIVLALATLAGVLVLWPGHDLRGLGQKLGLSSQVYGAEVLHSTHGPCGGDQTASLSKCQEVRVRLEQGPDRGKVQSLELADSASTPLLSSGDRIVLTYIPKAEPGFRYTYSDRQRRPTLLWLAVLFAVVVVLVGRRRGFGALVGLAASVVIILKFMLPAMLAGQSPALVAIVGTSAVAFVALYLANGFRATTTVALLSSLAALGLTVLLAELFTNLAHFTGAASEEVALLNSGGAKIDLSGLILAGMVIAALGALNDITVTQVSAVAELRNADPTLTTSALYHTGLRIGRDHIASTVNTLALAFAGASLPLLILFALSRQSLGTVANSESIAVEIVSILVGSIGLVAAVPISTWLAARIVADHNTHPPAGTTRPRRPPRRRPQTARRRHPPPEPISARQRTTEDFWTH
jgi:uncharacterized membrane protein